MNEWDKIPISWIQSEMMSNPTVTVEALLKGWETVVKLNTGNEYFHITIPKDGKR